LFRPNGRASNPAQVHERFGENRTCYEEVARLTHVRRAPVGAHRAAVQARAGLARRRLADGRALRYRRADPRRGRAQARARRVHARDPACGRGRLRDRDRAPERGHRPYERQPRRADRRRRAGARRADRHRHGARKHRAGRVARLRPRARRSRHGRGRRRASAGRNTRRRLGAWVVKTAGAAQGQNDQRKPSSQTSKSHRF